jgi:DNA-binding MltR family transcriptional regulator
LTIGTQRTSAAPTIDFDTMIDEVMKGAHTSQVIWAAALLDDALEQIIADRMPNMSNRFHEKLFEGYGPFATFSAKIDVAYAMNFIAVEMRTDLLHIKAVRNEFAHATKRLDFHAQVVKDLLAKFRAYDSVMDPHAFFMGRVSECHATLGKKRYLGALARALIASPTGPGLMDSAAPASPEKSE